jgi:uncharacterized protein (TIGR03437 family)
VVRGILLLASVNLLSASVQTLPALPANTSANAIQVDASGNIYIAGVKNPGSSNPDAFAAKLSPDGSQVVWMTALAGSADDEALAVALGADNSVYVTGFTTSADFVTTPSSAQPVKGNSGAQAFVAKLDSKGAVVYSTLLGGAASAEGEAIAVDAAGSAFVTGITNGPGFPATPGSVTGNPDSDSTFIVKLNPAGSVTPIAIRGFGGYAIAIDTTGSIYAAGAYIGPTAPTTAGAFQTSASNESCFGGFLTALPCLYQHVAKISAAGDRLIYATYIAGQWGATPRGIAVSANGEAIIAGQASGADYPVTPGAYQSIYTPNPLAQLVGKNLQAPVSNGYVTRLNATGTALVWSSYFGGSGAVAGSVPVGDSISAVVVAADGSVTVGGYAYSTDLPGLATTPVAVRPAPMTIGNGVVTGSGFVARFGADGGQISDTQLVTNLVNGVAVKNDGTSVALQGGLAMVSFPAARRVYAIADPADNARVVTVAPGQFLTLYGTHLATSSVSGVTVTFNGIVGPILYTSDVQINMQVPFDIAGMTEATMNVSSTLVSPPVSESYILAVVPRQPSAFLSAVNFNGPLFGQLSCNGATYAGVQAVATNADGSLNTCANPAQPGSLVNLYLNGLGAGNAAPAIMPFQLPAAGGPAITIPLSISGTRVREQDAIVWMKPAN